MKNQSPYRLHFILFLTISIVAIAQLGWWVIFQVQEGARVSSFQKALWEQEKNIARTYFDSAGLTPDEQSSWLNDNFPDLQLDSASSDLKVTADAEDRLNELAQKRVRMFVSEGAFFSLLVLTGVWFFYWALRKRIELEYRTANILTVASSGLQKPLAAIREDIEWLARTTSYDPDGENIIRNIERSVQQIADSCENVSLVRMLSTSKRRLELNLVNISDSIESSVNDYIDSHGSADRYMASRMEKNLSAVTNPGQLLKIVGGMLNVADNSTGNSGEIDIELAKEGRIAVLNINLKTVENGKNAETSLRETETGSSIIKELAETIGARVLVHSQDGINTNLRLEIPLFEE